MTLEIKFTHRFRFGYLWQSICPECYRIVAESRDEVDLEEYENTHVCLSLNTRLVRIA
jgi:hypothetical protein